MGEISKAKLLGIKRQRTHQRVNKAIKKTINKGYAEYKQHELNETTEKTETVLVNHLSNVHLTAFFQVVKINDVQNENDLRSSEIRRLH